MISKKWLALSFALVVIQCASADQPECYNLVGTWVNERGSVLKIRSVNFKTGKLTGTFTPPDTLHGEHYDVTGWANTPYDGIKYFRNHVQPISFTANWNEAGTIASWTGYCTDKKDDSTPIITTLWHHVNANSAHTWDHVRTGSDNFIPIP